VCAGLAGACALPLGRLASCSEKAEPQAYKYPFWFKSIFHGHDIPSVRRGYEVYRQVCATCHSMKQLHFRHLVNQVLPEKRMKQIAATYDVVDGPNDQGEMFTRPAILGDQFPNPYPNEEAARYANNGACPPDLSVYVTAKHEGTDYIMGLLLGYRDPPAGMELRAGLYYNPYFPGGAIGMPPPIQPGALEYEDGTPATPSQMAKDVVQFLVWAAEPVHDERKLLIMKAWTAILFSCFVFGAYYRASWQGLKSRRIDFTKAVLR
jgi:ubiquinol-cytochrome c reductase cytochrome c1 subunit